MACYICLGEGVQTSATGICTHCYQNACGRPPQRRDGQFHGDLCGAVSCGRFFCEFHLHTHPHASAGGVSAAFPNYAIAVAADVITDVDGIATDELPSQGVILHSVPSPLLSFNRFLNFVTPGNSALRAQIDRFPSDTFRLNKFHDDTLVWFWPNFFTRGATETMMRMADRSLRSAVNTLGTPLDLDVTHSGAVNSLGKNVSLFLLRPRLDLSDLPSEAQAEELIQFLLAKRDEGEEERLVMRTS